MPIRSNNILTQWFGISGLLFHIVGGTITYLYIVNDNWRNSISVLFTNSSWMYVGSIDLKQNKWLRSASGDVKRNFYTSEWRDGELITERKIHGVVGHIVSHDSKQMIIRHEAPQDSPVDTNFMDKPQIGNSTRGECYSVKRTILQPYHTGNDDRFAVWMYAASLSCK